MADNYIGNVLGILRLLKNTEGLGSSHAGISYIYQWAGDAGDNATLRVAAYVLDQASGAESLIQNSSLSDEAKQGLLQTTQALRGAFSLGGIGQAINAHLPALESSLSSFAILASATGVGKSAQKPKELDEILSDIDELKNSFDTIELDPLVKDVALKHLAVLKTLLSNIEAFGTDAAIAAYYELVIRLRRAEKSASSDTKTKLKTVWPKIEQWAGRLTIIEQAMNSGASILSDFSETAQNLLQYFPAS